MSEIIDPDQPETVVPLDQQLLRQAQDLSCLASRVDDLARANKSLKVFLILMVLAAVFTMLVARAERWGISANRSVAETFLFRGRNGTTGGFLGLDPQGNPTLALYDTNEKCRVSIGIREDGNPKLAFFDKNERSIVQLGQTSGGLPALLFFDDAGVQRMGVHLTSDGYPRIALSDKLVRDRVEIRISQDGTPMIGLFDDVTQRIVLDLMPDGTSRIAARSRNTKNGVGFTVAPNGVPRIDFDSNGRAFSLPDSK